MSNQSRKASLLTLSLLCGAWMVFDGVHVLAAGKYFGPEKPGPWSGLVAALGLDPFALGPAFIVLGLLWLMFATGTARGWQWTRRAGLLAASLTLWYLPFGTLIALAVLALLLLNRPAASKP